MKMKQKCGSKGFTLVELLSVVLFLVALVFVLAFFGAIFMGNQWYSSNGVLGVIQLQNPRVTKVLVSERRILRKSVVTVQLEDGSRQQFYLDSDILFNYTLKPKP